MAEENIFCSHVDAINTLHDAFENIYLKECYVCGVSYLSYRNDKRDMTIWIHGGNEFMETLPLCPVCSEHVLKYLKVLKKSHIKGE